MHGADTTFKRSNLVTTVRVFPLHPSTTHTDGSSTCSGATLFFIYKLPNANLILLARKYKNCNGGK